LAEEMARVFAKIATLVEGDLSFRWSDLDEAFSRKVPRIDAKHATTFGRLAQAVLGRREVSFRYRKLGAATAESRRLRPYHLGEIEGGWYVIGHDLARGALRTFALPRITALKLERASFERPASFDGKRYLLRSFGIWGGGEDEPLRLVRVELRDYAAGIVQERRWHPTQEVRPLNAAGTRVRFEVGRLEDLVRWVLGWGCKAKVLEPAELRAAVRREAALIGSEC
jgi:proteasome accessory factor B